MMSNQPQAGARLWDKGAALEALIHRFTVGDDPLIDRRLVRFDCLGSAAHVRTLERAGLLSAADAGTLLDGLREIAALASAGRFEIPAELEDCHTAIENHLTLRCGDAGARIHTGRSRNDQVATAMRLYLREAVLELAETAAGLTAALLERARRDGAAPMPGYTHMQPAMPSSVGLWLAAFADGLIEQMRGALFCLEQLDCSPLGTGAGFGVPLPLERAYTASLLRFSRVQRNPIDVQNSRGRLEQVALRVAVDVGGILEKLAWDLVLMVMPELGFFALPDALTTGSSIMPQKRNPDVLELMRARAGALRGRLSELEWIAGKLPSSYHRDLQLSKAPTIIGLESALEMTAAMTRVILGLQIRTERLRAVMPAELYATEAAYQLVAQGVPFRDAYKQVAAAVRSGEFQREFDAARYVGSGRVAEGDLEQAQAELEHIRGRLYEWRQRFAQAWAALGGQGAGQ